MKIDFEPLFYLIKSAKEDFFVNRKSVNKNKKYRQFIILDEPMAKKDLAFVPRCQLYETLLKIRKVRNIDLLTPATMLKK